MTISATWPRLLALQIRTKADVVIRAHEMNALQPEKSLYKRGRSGAHKVLNSALYSLLCKAVEPIWIAAHTSVQVWLKVDPPLLAPLNGPQ